MVYLMWELGSLHTWRQVCRLEGLGALMVPFSKSKI